MSTRDRSCFNAEGLPKVRFDSRAAANKRNGAVDAKAYRCPTCGYFHIGHYPTNRSTRRRLRKKHRS